MGERNLTLVGFLTWLAIGIPHVMRAADTGAHWTFYLALLIFGAAFAVATRDRCGEPLWVWMVLLEALAAFVCIAIIPTGFLAVLLVIIAGQLGRLTLLPAMAWVTAQTVIYFALVRLENESALVMTIAYFTFQLFAYVTARTAAEEKRARQELAETNAELQVATGLLDLSSRSEERLRIARDLHDLIGHHLTALSLNLEVASHLTEGPAREQIEKSRSLTRLLLSDVRDVVSRLRNEDPLDLGVALRSLRDAVPVPRIEIEGESHHMTDPVTAQTALRTVQEIVTNAVRHSGARHLRLHLREDERTLFIDAVDDGSGTDRIRFGNGLRGMRERVEQAGGSVEVASARGKGFEVHVRLPL